LGFPTFMLVGFPDFRLLRIPGSARLKIFRENSTFKKNTPLLFRPHF
jgi:hypothetical protein